MSQSYSNKAKKKTKFRIAFGKFSDKTVSMVRHRKKGAKWGNSTQLIKMELCHKTTRANTYSNVVTRRPSISWLLLLGWVVPTPSINVITQWHC